MYNYHTEIQIRSNALILYNLPNEPRKFLATQNPFKHLPKSYSGTVTPGAKKRITKAVNLLIQSTRQVTVINPVTNKSHPFKLSFVTLTVSSTSRMLTAKEGHKELLEPLILYLRRKHGLKSYVWKAELQKRGQIHYHLTSDCFINHTALKNKWNELQRKVGCLDDYYNISGHFNPNSTDIHSVYKVKNLETYLIKYLAKPGSLSDKTIGKVWDCSQNLKLSNYFTTTSTYDIEAELFKREHAGNITVMRAERFTIVNFNSTSAINVMPPDIQLEYSLHMKSIREFVKPAPIKKISNNAVLPEWLVYSQPVVKYVQLRLEFPKKI